MQNKMQNAMLYYAMQHKMQHIFFFNNMQMQIMLFQHIYYAFF